MTSPTRHRHRCSVDDCDRVAVKGGLCYGHARRLRVWGGTFPHIELGRRRHWLCECSLPKVDELGECLACHRKPRGLLRPDLARSAS